MVKDCRQRLSGGELFQADNRNLVFLAYFLIIILIGKSEGKHTLLFQVRFMDAGEAFGKDHFYIQETRLHSGMFARRSLTIIFFCYDDR